MSKAETARVAFNKTEIARLPPPADRSKRAYWFDTKVAGLAVCVTATGSRTFYLVRKINGRPVRVRLGKFPEFGCEQARKMALQLIGDIAHGHDPQARRRLARQEPILADLFARWLEYAKAHKRTWSDDERQFNKFLKPWKNRRLSAIGRPDVQAWHSRLGRENGPYSANRALALVRAMFGKAQQFLGWNGPNPCTGIEQFPETKRDRFLQPAELPAFFQSLTAEPNETLRDFFAVALFTGQRRRAVQAMAWGDVDLASRLWRVPEARSKNTDPIYVPLDEAVVSILSRRAEARNGNAWVFPSPIDSKTHLREPKHAWDRLCTRAGLTGVRMHDLRRTFGSYAAITGASLTIIGKALGHRSLAATEVYARLTMDPVRDASSAAVTAIRNAGGLLPPPEKPAAKKSKPRRKAVLSAAGT